MAKVRSKVTVKTSTKSNSKRPVKPNMGKGTGGVLPTSIKISIKNK